ncbi:hypothetical protein [Poseidonocella sedimentorum]|uniref:Uncharacterized protein n=1 Tax=Poseidonocella sedimentorum TaxID=871652 RepID=A0A1I6E985_9RHOB|nr:hypothetical protein [Poseidonocella sedimentorum]SFR14121.1 hypothetical protein SAMN04515673_10887 [Poseidonocella sedimentorum]
MIRKITHRLQRLNETLRRCASHRLCYRGLAACYAGLVFVEWYDVIYLLAAAIYAVLSASN